MADDREILARSFGHTLDLVESLLDELPDTEDHMHARDLVERFRRLLERSNAQR